MALHGFTGCGLDWELPVACCGEEVGGWLAPDLPGHGGSVGLAAAGYSLEGIASGLHRLISTLPVKPVLLGYSFGGRAAVEYAVRHGDSLAGLVLIGATAGIEAPAERAARRQADLRLARRLRALPVDEFAQEWEEQAILRSQDAIPSPWRERLRRRRRRQQPAELARSLAAAGQGAMQPRWSQLAAITVPTLAIAGARDSKYRAFASDFSRFIPQSRLRTLPACGHSSHLEKPLFFARILLSFLHAPT